MGFLFLYIVLDFREMGQHMGSRDCVLKFRLMFSEVCFEVARSMASKLYTINIKPYLLNLRGISN